jgi:hypothetical protein
MPGRAAARLLAGLLLASLVPAGAPRAEDYQWAISASIDDPWVNEVPPTGVPQYQLFLWLTCASAGVSGAEFGLEIESGVILAGGGCCGFSGYYDFIGWILEATGCPSAPAYAGQVIVWDAELDGFRLGFTTAAITGRNVTLDCESPPQAHENAWVGFASDGGPAPRSGACGPVSVEGSTWGRVKSLYRDGGPAGR